MASARRWSDSTAYRQAGTLPGRWIVRTRPGVRRIFWRPRALWAGFLDGDLSWGDVRIVVIIATFIVFGLGGALLETFFLALQGPGWQAQFPNLAGYPEQIALWTVAISRSWRYLLIPITMFLVAMMVGAHYIQDIYELPNYRIGIRYLLASVFAKGYPHLMIVDGKKQLRVGEINTLAEIGGPGYVRISPGNAVLFEHLTHPSNVRSSGWHFISRFETIKEIVDLSDQQGYVEKLPAMTKDGIVVSVQDIHFRYRLWGTRRFGGPTGRTPVTPYPYSIKAMRNLVYNRAMRHDGLTPWNSAIQLIIEGVIQDYIRGNTIDAVTAPPSTASDPRGDMRRQYIAAATRARLRDVGAQLLWFDMGHIVIEKPEVEQQRIETWQAEWVGDAEVIRSFGEAQRQAVQELARAEANAEILMSIIHSLDKLERTDANPSETLKKIFLTRTAQVLESLSKVYESERSQLTDKND